MNAVNELLRQKQQHSGVRTISAGADCPHYRTEMFWRVRDFDQVEETGEEVLYRLLEALPKWLLFVIFCF